MLAPDQLSPALAYLRNCLGDFRPEWGLILGSGLGPIAEAIDPVAILPYGEIPDFPQATVPGHAGRMVFGHLRGKAVIAMQGRLHAYEGHPWSHLAFPVRLMQALGVSKLLVTAASGSVNPELKAGELMLIEDHLNLVRQSPLRSPDLRKGGRLRRPGIYSPDLIRKARQIARGQQFSIRSGVYAYVLGPSFETPAEVKMIRLMGGDVVGMSTVPEALMAAHLGLKVLGLTYVSNLGAGMATHPLSYQDVVDTMARIQPKVVAYVSALVEGLSENEATRLGP